MGLTCRHCGSGKTKKNGNSRGYARYLCRDCGRTFSGAPPKHSDELKDMAVKMSLNGVGVRKTALLLRTSHANVLNWLKKVNKSLSDDLKKTRRDHFAAADIIELDEIYTFIKKNSVGLSFGRLILGTKDVLLRL